MASRKDTILKAAKRPAKQAHDAASSRGSGKLGRFNAEPHRHCVVCWKPIPLDSDPAICVDESCEKMHSRREKSRKRFSVLLYLGVAIFIGMLAIQLIAGG